MNNGEHHDNLIGDLFLNLFAFFFILLVIMMNAKSLPEILTLDIVVNQLSTKGVPEKQVAIYSEADDGSWLITYDQKEFEKNNLRALRNEMNEDHLYLGMQQGVSTANYLEVLFILQNMGLTITTVVAVNGEKGS